MATEEREDALWRADRLREEAGKTALAAHGQLLLDLGYWPFVDRSTAEFDAIVRSFPVDCVAVGPDLGKTQLPGNTGTRPAASPEPGKTRSRVVIDWWYMPNEDDPQVLWLKSPIEGVEIEALIEAARERMRHCKRTGKTGKATLGQALRWVIAHPKRLQGIAAFERLK